MNAADKEFLDSMRWLVESYSQESPPRKIGFNDRAKLLEVVRRNFDEKASPDLWCESCVKSFILNTYLQYDNYFNEEKGTEGKD